MTLGVSTDQVVASDDGARLLVQVHDVEATGSRARRPDEPTLVLAHGWALDHRSWDPVVARWRGGGRHTASGS